MKLLHLAVFLALASPAQASEARDRKTARWSSFMISPNGSRRAEEGSLDPLGEIMKLLHLAVFLALASLAWAGVSVHTTLADFRAGSGDGQIDFANASG